MPKRSMIYIINIDNIKPIIVLVQLMDVGQGEIDILFKHIDIFWEKKINQLVNPLILGICHTHKTL